MNAINDQESTQRIMANVVLRERQQCDVECSLEELMGNPASDHNNYTEQETFSIE